MSPKSVKVAKDKEFSMDDFAKALENQKIGFDKGDVVRGKVVNHDTDGAMVDIGGKSAAFLPAEEIANDPTADLAALVPIGESQDFLIIREPNADGSVTISRRQLQEKYAWDNAADWLADKQSLSVRVIGTNKGGVVVDVQGLRGFIPRSQLSEKELDSYVGTTISAIVIEANIDDKKLVLSQRQATKAASFSLLEVGQLITGEVVSLKPFGAFVDFQGNTGLLHVRQISQKPVDAVESILTIGQEVKALIVDLDEGGNRISLSTRVLENFPGEMLENMSEVMNSADSRAPRAANQLFGK
jgi:small subunit ribosomal protein S1